MGETKRYYWLKLKKDFFKRHDIRIIEKMYGDGVILFYIKLLVESVDHEGRLRFSESVPYTAQMLGIITDTETEYAQNALNILLEIGLIRKEEDGTLVFPKIEKMIGSAADNDNAKRQQRFRDRMKEAQSDASVTDDVTIRDASVTDSVTKSNADITQTVTNSNESKSKSKSKSKKEKNIKEKHTHGSFQNVLLTEEEYDRLKTEYGSEADEAIEFFSAYLKEKPSYASKTKDHNLTIRRWVFNAIREQKAKTGAKKTSMSQMMTRNDIDIDDLEKRLLSN